MKFAQITITVEIDENKLTQKHLDQAMLADKDPFVDHPADNCVETLTGSLKVFCGEFFTPLMENHTDVVEIIVEN